MKRYTAIIFLVLFMTLNLFPLSGCAEKKTSNEYSKSVSKDYPDEEIHNSNDDISNTRDTISMGQTEQHETPENISSKTDPDDLSYDFSEISGGYVADDQYAKNYGATCPDLVIGEDGAITGGGLFYSWGHGQEFASTPPISVTASDDIWGEGTSICMIVDSHNTETEDGKESYSEYYVIYPKGVPDIHNPNDNTEKTRIRYVIMGGGVTDMIYIKVLS